MEDDNKIKRYIKSKYTLRWYNIKNKLDEIEKEGNKKKIFFADLPMGLKNYEEVIMFKCYNNEILNYMIKNIKIDIETIKNKLAFIKKYEDLLTENWEVRDCENEKRILEENIIYNNEDIKYLSILLN